MSRKGNCYDNATMESFWSTLKLELVYRRDFATRPQARTEIFDYIEAFYNRQRSHSALNYLSPVEFELINNGSSGILVARSVPGPPRRRLRAWLHESCECNGRSVLRAAPTPPGTRFASPVASC